MAQITSGVMSILSQPLAYDALQAIMGAGRLRRELAGEFIRARPGMRILDVGCGTAEILRFLPADIEYWGYDISGSYIEVARRRFGERGSFNCGVFDRAAARRLPKVDALIAIGVLHHLDDAEATELFRLAGDVLVDTGKVVTCDPCLVEDQSSIARFLIRSDRGRNVRDVTGYSGLAANQFATVTGEVRHRAWIPYTHWIMECAQ